MVQPSLQGAIDSRFESLAFLYDPYGNPKTFLSRDSPACPSNTPMTPLIDDALKTFIEGGVSVSIGTCDSDLAPATARAWGPRVGEDRRSLSLCIVAAASGKTLHNIRHNGRVAVAFSLPTNYKTAQIKGRWIETADAALEDLAAVERHREAFIAATQTIGASRDFVELYVRRELLSSPVLAKIVILSEQIFDQTPGPGAGSPLVISSPAT